MSAYANIGSLAFAFGFEIVGLLGAGKYFHHKEVFSLYSLDIDLRDNGRSTPVENMTGDLFFKREKLLFPNTENLPWFVPDAENELSSGTICKGHDGSCDLITPWE